MKHILVFGSLRKHSKKGYNFNRCGEQTYIRSLTLDGYVMRSLGAYPAIHEGKGTIHCELHTVDDKTAQNIDRMEIGAGYYAHIIDMPEGPSTIYLYDEQHITDCPIVKSGDWN